MAENQKYYYMRLRADFFNRKDIILLESMQNGAVYCLILLKLLTASLENNGHLMLNEEIVMTPAMLATITRYDVGTVEKALQIFMQLGLVEQLPDGSYYMLEIEGMVGKTSTEADRKRLARAKVNIIDTRYKSGRPLIITTNLTLEELNYPTDVQHKRIYDRVLGMCVPVKFIGANFRKQEAATKMSTAKRLFGIEDK